MIVSPRFECLILTHFECTCFFKLMKIGKTVLGKRLFKQLMKATFYGQFVAGEDQQEIKPIIQRMRSFGVKSILDYSAEEDVSAEEAVEKEMA